MRLPAAAHVRTHMGTKLKTAGAMIVGSFLIYCGQSATEPDGGFVKDADAADGCGCTTAPTFTKITELTVAAGASSPDIAVGQYREVIVYSTASAPAGCSFSLGHRFRPDAATEYGYTGQNNTGRLRVDGSDLKVNVNNVGTSSCTSVGIVVAGVR